MSAKMFAKMSEKKQQKCKIYHLSNLEQIIQRSKKKFIKHDLKSI